MIDGFLLRPFFFFNPFPNRMKRAYFPLLAAGLLTLAACGDASKTADTGTDSNLANTPAAGADTTSTQPAMASDSSATGSGSAMTDPNGPTGPHKDDNEFMMTAAHSDQNEIQQSKMVLAKGVTGMAKDMANQMIADHTKSTADLKKIADKKGVTLPTDMDAEHKALAPAMEKLSGKELEAKYLAQMQTDHQKTANTMAAHAKMTQDADLQAFISKTLPVVEQHLSMAQKGNDMKM
jgi:putative membrane protein